MKTVVIDGRVVMENRVIPGVDEAADHARAQKQFEGLVARYPERTWHHPPVADIFRSSFDVVDDPSSPASDCA